MTQINKKKYERKFRSQTSNIESKIIFERKEKIKKKTEMFFCIQVISLTVKFIFVYKTKAHL